jgi:hypothetical protein
MNLQLFNQEINGVLTDIEDETKSTDIGLAMEPGFIKQLSNLHYSCV